MPLENYNVAIINMVNELAGRYGLRPYDFTAVVYSKDVQPYDIELRFESPPNDDKKMEALDRMLIDLGIPNVLESADMPRLVGSEETVYNALEAALQRAPQRGRGR